MGKPADLRILIIGCGQLGSRHLQAVASLPQVREVEVVDPRPEALELGRKRLSEIPGPPSAACFRWLSSLEQASREGNLCIVATQAGGRCERVKEAARTLGYRAFLLEKLVGQSIQEVEDLAGFVKERGLAAWVNLKTRCYPIHQEIKKKLDRSEPVLFSVTGGNHGLANNGIHAADLFLFYDGADRLEEAGSWIDPVLHPSKRGDGLFDLSGTLIGTTEKGGRFTLTYAPDHELSEQIVIATRRFRCVVDHLQRWAMESSEGSGWAWKPVPFAGDLTVSRMTKGFVSEILEKGRCGLPTLEESLAAHRFILGILRPHFARLLEREVELCPVT